MSKLAARSQSQQEKDTDRQFERALLFAQWQKHQNGEWRAPESATENLVDLVKQVL